MTVLKKTIVFKIKKFTDNYVKDRYEESSLTIVNEGLSLTIVKETLNFKKRSFLENERLKKIHATLLNVVLHEIKELRGGYNFLIFS